MRRGIEIREDEGIILRVRRREEGYTRDVHGAVPDGVLSAERDITRSKRLGT